MGRGACWRTHPNWDSKDAFPFPGGHFVFIIYSQECPDFLAHWEISGDAIMGLICFEGHKTSNIVYHF